MAAKIINGKELSDCIREKLRAKTIELKQQYGITPGLAVVLVGEDQASKVYVRNKAKACENLGYYSEQHNLPETTTTQKLLELIHQLNESNEIHGILVQLPLPKTIDSNVIINAISPYKDVDGFTTVNQGAILQGNYNLVPCTPAGIVELIKSTGESLDGKNCAVVGRSNIVGKPVALMLLDENATVTICHSRTENLQDHCKCADIIVAAVGIENFIKANFIKPGAIVIDVGINRGVDGKLCGDVDYQTVKEVAGYITPVPGGVGPMTITELMKNTYTAAKRTIK